MWKSGEIDMQDLTSLGNVRSAEGESASFATRMLDSDGDGRFDLFLMDGDNDGVIDGVVRGFDSNGDGVNDVFAHYNEDGEISSIGRVNPETGELEVIYEEPGFFDELLESLGLADTGPPDDALFTSFDDPYIVETYGSFGEEVPDEAPFTLVVEPADILEIEDYAGESEGVTILDESGMGLEASSDDAGQGVSGETAGGSDSIVDEAGTGAEKSDAAPAVTELSDASGAKDGSDLWVSVDKDGDGLADYEKHVEKVGDSYLADIDEDGYSDRVATDLDGDSRVDSVDAKGRGSSADQVAVSTVAAPDSEHLVDTGPGDEDEAGGGPADASPSPDSADSGAGQDAEPADTSADDAYAPDDSSDTDSYSSSDTGGADTDAGSSDSYDPGTSGDIDSGTE